MPIVSRAEMERRWATLRQAMAAHDIDAVIATSSAGASDLPVHPRLGLATAGQGLRLIWLRRQPTVDVQLPRRCERRLAGNLRGRLGGVERFFGRVVGFFHLQRPPVSGWSAVTARVALTSTAALVLALAAHQAVRPDLIRSPTRVLAHRWEGGEEL